MEHMDALGAPLQVRLTVPLKPLFAVTCKL